MLLVFDQGLEPGEGFVPLPGDAIEGLAGFFEPLGTQFEEVFAALAHASNEAGILQDQQVLSDGLAGESGAVREGGDRESRSLTEPHQECQPRLVTQGGEQWHIPAQVSKSAVTASW